MRRLWQDTGFLASSLSKVQEVDFELAAASGPGVGGTPDALPNRQVSLNSFRSSYRINTYSMLARPVGESRLG